MSYKTFRKQPAVKLQPYNNNWPMLFSSEQKRLQPLFAPGTVIQHFGSTAVPTLEAKPVIDILAGVADLALLDINILTQAGYVYLPELEQTNPERRFFVLYQNGVIAYQLHVVKLNSPYWTEKIAFRDILRSDQSAAMAYAQLKQDLAQKMGHNRGAYAGAKTDFIIELLAQHGIKAITSKK